MTQANDSLFFEIIRSAHGPAPAASRYYRPFDVGPRVNIADRAATGARPLAALAVWIASAARSLGARLPHAGAAAEPCCQPA